MDRTDARTELWRRFDAGELTAAEVEARLVLLERAGEDHDDDRALRQALDRPLPLLRRSRSNRTIVGAALLVGALVLGGGVLAVAKGDNGGSPTATSQAGAGFVPTIAPFPPGAVVGPAVPVGPDVFVDPAVECVPPDPLPSGPAGDTAANPALLSEPAAVPEGYEVDDDDAIEPGTDPDLAMSISAGEPLPVEIRGRVLDGDLGVRMRAFRYEDAEAAAEAAAFAAASACTYSPTSFAVPDRPEIGVVTVTGVIPLTAFASWHIGDRRVTVAVEADGEGEGARAEAVELAGQIAAAEYDAAGTAPGAG